MRKRASSPRINSRELEREKKRILEEKLITEAREKNEAIKTNLSLLRDMLPLHVKRPHRLNWNSLRIDRDFGLDPPRKPTMCVPFPLDYLLSVLPGKWMTPASWNRELTGWKVKKDKFEGEKKERNISVSKLEADYNSALPVAISKFSELILTTSPYPSYFPSDHMAEYREDDKLLIVLKFIPSIDQFPDKKEVKYIKSNKEIRDVQFNQKEKIELFEHIAYSICLRTIAEVFMNDLNGYVDRVSFTGYVETKNLANGKMIKPPIFSVEVTKEAFSDILLGEVAPKKCFLEALKGISYRKLENLVPIKPVQIPMRKDPRFVESRAIAADMQEGENLAAMGWKEFEDFVVDLFRAIYAKVGGSVERTQSSGDGGVDAIAHDPTPVTGGEIVIQAKRYTSTIGPDQIRELYGMLIHEGAIKAIFVTTSRFGPAALQTAVGKPIELIDGNQLLGLTEQYLGKNFRIELSEAKGQERKRKKPR